MRSVPVGVLGHVDHGKTALVRALTGTDTDRLEEEKRRGISIALGFARLRTPGGEVDLIDMPGHERFVRTMVAGATGIEAALLVVAANEGVRPQTLEHVEIAGLVGVRRAVVAVTKCDLVEPAQAGRAAADARRLCIASGLGEPAVAFVSVVTGDGLDGVSAHLAALLEAGADQPDHGFFHLPVDRVFAVAGFGTVVTGTLRRGPIAVGNMVELVPGGALARVRGLQVHGCAAERVGPGRRTAVNLRGVDQDAVAPGQALATPGLVAASRMLDVRLVLLGTAARPVETGRSVRLLVGTVEVSARIRLLDRDTLDPGQGTVAQLKCDDAVAAPAGEPFILRAHSPVRTIGGGVILDPLASRRRRHDEGVLGHLRALAAERPEATLARRLDAAGWAGCGRADLARRIGRSPEWIEARLAGLRVRTFADGGLLPEDRCRALRERVLDALAGFHRAHPALAGMARDRLRAGLPPDLAPTVFESILADLVAEGSLRHDQGLLRRCDIDPAASMSPAQRNLIARLEQRFRRSGLLPPDIAEVAGRDAGRLQALRFLVRSGALVLTRDRVQRREIVFHRSALATARERLAGGFAEAAGGFLVADAGRLLGISRKYSIPLLEHLDAEGFTRRVGDRRVLVGRSARPAGQ